MKKNRKLLDAQDCAGLCVLDQTSGVHRCNMRIIAGTTPANVAEGTCGETTDQERVERKNRERMDIAGR